MSVFVDFVGLNTLVSSTFATDVFDNVITSSLSRQGQAVGTVNYGGSNLTIDDSLTLSDGGLQGGIGAVTFICTGSAAQPNEFTRGGSVDATYINLNSKINNYPGLRLTATIATFTNLLTVTNESFGAAGNVEIIENLTPLTTISGMAGGAGIDPTFKLAAINLHRNGPYNFSTFKQIRIHENPLTRYQRRNNLLSFAKRGNQTEISSSVGILQLQQKFGSLITFTEPSVISTYHPLQYNLGHHKGDKKLFIERFGLGFDYGNHITYFTNEELNKLLLLDDLDDEVYEQIKKLYLNGALETNASEISYFEFLRYKQEIYPREINKYSSKVRQRTNYQNDFWRDIRSERSFDRSISNGFGTTISQSMWHMDAEVTWSSRSAVPIGINPKISAEGILQNKYCHFTDDASRAAEIKPAPVYTRRHTIPKEYTGSVVAPYGINIPETGSAYNHDAGAGNIFQGDALWEAGEQAGKNPFYSSYDYFVEELRGVGKDYSIVPEFRISDHVETLLKQGNLTKLTNMLEVTGGNANSNISNEANFYETYSTTDFLKHFAKIKNDHQDFVDPATITLTCKGLKKFLSYDSFYPQDRTVDCATQFYDSYEKYISFSGLEDAGIQPFLDPLMAPGVLYNSIKSGVAVDYPLFSTISVYSSGGLDAGGAEDKFYAIGAPAATQRIPFEALVEPEKYLGEQTLSSNTAHLSGNLVGNEASWDGKGDNLYTKMMSNFLAEVPDFFLQGSDFTSIVSEEQGSDNFGVAEFGKSYAMRLKMYSSRDSNTPIFARTNPAGGSTYVGGYIPPQASAAKKTITMYSRPSAFGPAVAGYEASQKGHGILNFSYDSRKGFNPVYTPPYYDGEAWIDFVWKAPAGGTAALSAGQQTGKFSLSEIFSTITSSALRIDTDLLSCQVFGDTIDATDTGPLNVSTKVTNFPSSSFPFDQEYLDNSRVCANFNAMQLNASVNPLQSGRVILRDAENDTLLNENIQQVIDVNKGATNARWVIQTKFETPILNFKNVSLTTASVNLHSAQTPRGMWHQYGLLPENNEGIYLQIQDLPQNWLKYRNQPENRVNYNWATTGSLADLVGFNTNPVKLGQVAQGKIVREAVVAVPYITDGGIKKFFEINEENSNNAEKYFQALDIVNKGGDPSALGLNDPEYWEQRAGASVIKQVRKMKRYVFPPTMDFVSNPEVTPFSMYIFEFEHTLSQQDLADIWQGLPPDLGTSFEVAEDSVSHPLLANQLLGSGIGTDKSRIGADLNKEIRWMVFKVKQRAKTNYFDKIIGKKSGYGQAAASAGFSTNASSETAAQAKISYNWPYDFFSLVELVKIDAEVEFADIPEGKFEPKQTEIPEAVQTFAANLSSRRK